MQPIGYSQRSKQKHYQAMEGERKKSIESSPHFSFGLGLVLEGAGKNAVPFRWKHGMNIFTFNNATLRAVFFFSVFCSSQG